MKVPFGRAIAMMVAIGSAGHGVAVAKDHARAFFDWVAQGSPSAVSAAVEAMRTSDAGDAESLTDALGRAMQVAPARVLPLVDSGSEFSADRICVPFLSDDQPVPAVLRSLERSRQSIASVSEVGLARQRAACLRVIARYEKTVRRQRQQQVDSPRGR
jgi:hypothetical protein